MIITKFLNRRLLLIDSILIHKVTRSSTGESLCRRLKSDGWKGERTGNFKTRQERINHVFSTLNIWIAAARQVVTPSRTFSTSTVRVLKESDRSMFALLNLNCRSFVGTRG